MNPKSLAHRLLLPCAIATLPLSPGATAADLPRLELEPMRFEASDGRSVDAERGTLTVTANRRDPESGTLDLAFVRFRSTAEKPGAPIVYLAGGPGGSGMAAARGTRFDLFQALTAVADVIAFDQRGTGESQPQMGCATPWMIPLDRPLDLDVAGPILARAAAACADQLRDRGLDLDAYTTEDSADDLEDLRRALEVEKISLWGISYGTHLALATLRRHPGSVEKAILAGVEPLDHTLKLPSDQQALLERIAELAAADPATRAAVPDLLGSLSGLLERLAEKPVTLPLVHPETGQGHEVTVGALDLRVAVANRLTGPETFRTLPDLVARLEAGDFRSLVLEAAGDRLGGGLPGMTLAMDCASGADPAWLERIETEARDTLLGDAINQPFQAACEGFPVRDLGSAFRQPVRSKVPTLLISGTLDGRTPPSNAESVLPGLARGRHLVIEGAGHSDPLFLSSPRIVEAMTAFLRTGEIPFSTVAAPAVEFLAPRLAVSLPPEKLARYEGAYRISEDEVRSVILAGDQLWTRRGDGAPLPIFPRSETEFFYSEAATWLRFESDDEGRVLRMVMFPDGRGDGEPAFRENPDGEGPAASETP